MPVSKARKKKPQPQHQQQVSVETFHPEQWTSPPWETYLAWHLRGEEPAFLKYVAALPFMVQMPDGRLVRVSLEELTEHAECTALETAESCRDNVADGAWFWDGIARRLIVHKSAAQL